MSPSRRKTATANRSGARQPLRLRALRVPPSSSSQRQNCARELQWCSAAGLGAFADELATAKRIPYDAIPGFPRSTVQGHSGQLVIGTAAGVPMAVMQGRAHLYEGYSPKEVVFPMRVLGRAWHPGGDPHQRRRCDQSRL